jgi:hypothetical protein
MDHTAGGDKAPAYQYRPSLLGRAYAFRLTPGGLAWEVGPHAGTVPYRAIRRVRLSYRPIGLANYRFQAEIWAADAPKLTLASTSWRSLAEQERQDAAYAAFVRALHQRLVQAGSTAQFEAGTAPLLYWPGVVVLVVLALGTPYVLVRAAQAGAAGGAAIVAALMLVFFWQLGTFFWRNRPGRYAPEALPVALLPRS